MVSVLCSNQIVGFPNNIKAYDGIVWVDPKKHLMKGWMRALLEHSELEQDSQIFKKGSTYVRLVRTTSCNCGSAGHLSHPGHSAHVS